nr:penicillopepsin-1 [Quercus suber]
MHPALLFLTFGGLTLAAPASLESYAYAEDEYEGLRIPMEKKAIDTPLLKRVPGAAAFTVQSTLMPANETGDAPLYDPSKSSTANSKAWPGYSCEDFGFTGPVYNETITVGGQAFSNVALCVWNHAPQAEYGDRTGNLGMGPGGVFADPSIPIFMEQIASRIPKQGELDIGFVDTSKYTGTLTWRTSLQRDYWYIQIDAVVNATTGQAVPTSTVAAFRALLDHGGGGMTLRRDYLDYYFGKIPGAVFDSGDSMYHYPCNANLPDMVFSTGGLPLHVPKWSWKGSPISTGSSTCKPDISLVNPDTPDSVYFGTGFLESVFCAFNYTDFSIGLANRPAYSTTVPSYSVAGSTKLCTGTGFSGTCTQSSWKSNTCVSLSGTPNFHNTSSFSPSLGYCTLYSDTACATPFSSASGVKAPGQSNTGAIASTVGSYACFYPSDYPPRGSSSIQFCTGQGFSGTCDTMNWNSFECHNLDTSVSKKFLSAGPSNGYCYLFTNKGCTGAIENGAPFVFPGRTDAEFALWTPCLQSYPFPGSVASDSYSIEEIVVTEHVHDVFVSERLSTLPAYLDHCKDDDAYAKQAVYGTFCSPLFFAMLAIAIATSIDISNKRNVFTDAEYFIDMLTERTASSDEFDFVLPSACECLDAHIIHFSLGKESSQ